jgi:hypothetical protein
MALPIQRCTCDETREIFSKIKEMVAGRQRTELSLSEKAEVLYVCLSYSELYSTASMEAYFGFPKGTIASFRSSSNVLNAVRNIDKDDIIVNMTSISRAVKSIPVAKLFPDVIPSKDKDMMAEWLSKNTPTKLPDRYQL